MQPVRVFLCTMKYEDGVMQRVRFKKERGSLSRRGRNKTNLQHQEPHSQSRHIIYQSTMPWEEVVASNIGQTIGPTSRKEYVGQIGPINSARCAPR